MKKALTILLSVILCICMFGCGSEDPAPEPEQDASTTNEQEVIVSEDLTEVPKFTAEQKTSEMVDQIGFTAKDYATNLTDSDSDKIIETIRNANHEFYNSTEEMEKYMWYGYLLDYKYDDSDPRSALGTDLVQAIKYVYRGAEGITDDATVENLHQLDKDLDNI